MSIIEVTVPVLPESVSEATLMTWHKKVGEAVARDENIIDLETDKVVLELPAPQAGVIVEIVEQDGATVVSGQLIAKIDTAAKASDAAPAAEATQATAAPAAEAAPQSNAQAGVAMPAAAKLAAEKGVDVASIQGSGRDGRVLKEDVANAQAAPAAAPTANPTFSTVTVSPTPTVQIAGDRPEQRVPMSRLRQRVAERLLQSQSENAILTTFNEVNMQPVMDLRNKYKDKFQKEHDV